MKQTKQVKPFIETADVRDGLFPHLRYALAQLRVMNDENDGKFRCSKRIVGKVAGELQVDSNEVYEALLNATYPRCETNLVDGHGNMGFPPAYMEYTEMKTSNFYKEASRKGENADFNSPLNMPFPYVLSNGVAGPQNTNTKIPPHNLGEVIDATIALIKNPTLETKDLMQYINGPDLLIYGEIADKAKLCKVYEKGYGVIKIKITPQNINDMGLRKIIAYCKWYKIKIRKIFLKNEYMIFVPYNALLYDGKSTKLMSLKEILQKYIEHYKAIENISNELFCEKLTEFKKLSGERKTKA